MAKRKAEDDLEATEDRVHVQDRVAKANTPFLRQALYSSMPKRYRRRSGGANLALINADARKQMLLEQYDPKKQRGSDYSRETYGRTWATANATQKANRLATGYRGRGDYKSALAGFLPGFSRSVGRGIGGFFGHADKGEGLGGDFSRWMGWGRYRRRRRIRRRLRGRGDYGGEAGGNQIMAGSVETPISVNASDDLSGDIYFSHREFVMNVQALVPASGLSTFNVTPFPLNCGMAQTFPWLSQVAQNFTLYEFCGLVFEYRPTSGELGSSSNQLGKVIMATQYDPDAPQFTSSVQMENYDYANACKPSEHMIHGVETDPKQTATKMLYVRSGTSAKDLIFTDLGTFQIATEGVPVTGTAGTYQNIGELWVSYRIKLSRARLYGSLLNANIQQDNFIAQADNPITTLVANTNSFLATKSWGISNFSQFQTNQMATRKDNTIGTSVIARSAGPKQQFVITWPQNIVSGYYMVTWGILPGAAITATFATPFSATNCTQVTLNGVLGMPDTVLDGVDAANTNTITQTFFVYVSAPGTLQASITVGLSALATNSTTSWMTITQVPQKVNI